MLPVISTSDPYSPSARANASAQPATIAGVRFGSNTLRKIRRRDAPTSAAAVSIFLLVLSVVLLFALNLVAKWSSRHANG